MVIPVYKQGNRGAERLGHLPAVVQAPQLGLEPRQLRSRIYASHHSLRLALCKTINKTFVIFVNKIENCGLNDNII